LSEMKTCSTCEGKLPRTIEYFVSVKASKDGLSGQYRTCRSAYKKRYNKENRASIREREKVYEKSHKENKAIADKKYRDKHKQEAAEYSKQYRKDNKERLSEQKKRFYLENKEEVNKKNRKKWHENKEYLHMKSKIYREANKSVLREKGLKYQKENRDSANVRSHNYRARKRQLPHTLTSSQWKLIKSHFDNKCSYCGKSSPLAQEHFLAANNGGEYAISNIVPSCQSCNSSKNASNFFIWYPKQKFYSKARESKILKFLGYKDKNQQLSIF